MRSKLVGKTAGEQGNICDHTLVKFIRLEKKDDSTDKRHSKLVLK